MIQRQIIPVTLFSDFYFIKWLNLQQTAADMGAKPELLSAYCDV